MIKVQIGTIRDSKIKDSCKLKVKIDDPIQKIFSIFLENEISKKNFVTWKSKVLSKEDMKQSFSKMEIKDGDKFAIVSMDKSEE